MSAKRKRKWYKTILIRMVHCMDKTKRQEKTRALYDDNDDGTQANRVCCLKRIIRFLCVVCHLLELNEYVLSSVSTTYNIQLSLFPMCYVFCVCAISMLSTVRIPYSTWVGFSEVTLKNKTVLFFARCFFIPNQAYDCFKSNPHSFWIENPTDSR